jgi:hypothetical protein
MTQRYIDDVTGEIIATGRAFRIQPQGGSFSGVDTIDVQDVDQVLAIVRDKLTGKNQSPPVEIVVQSWTHMPLDTQYRKYAPPEPEPEEIPEDDAPFNEVRSFKVPSFPSLGGFTMALPPEMRVPSYASQNSQYEFLTIPPKRSQEEIDAADDRLRKWRHKYAKALAEFCGCKDVAAHEGNLK